MLIDIDENDNCEPVPGRVFNEQEHPRSLTRIRQQRQGEEFWCDVVAVDPGPAFKPALARKVDDSGEGSCFLIYGGAWGIRLRHARSPTPWSLADTRQWGEGFILVSAEGTDVQFDPENQRL